MGNIIYYQLLVGLSVFCQDLGTPSDKIWPGPPSYSELPAVKKVRIKLSCNISNTGKSVSSDIQTLRSELKNEVQASFFF